MRFRNRDEIGFPDYTRCMKRAIAAIIGRFLVDLGTWMQKGSEVYGGPFPISDSGEEREVHARVEPMPLTSPRDPPKPTEPLRGSLADRMRTGRST
jgi:hypothetical protein